jgi:hypothetical protein
MGFVVHPSFPTQADTAALLAHLLDHRQMERLLDHHPVEKIEVCSILGRTDQPPELSRR